MKLKIGIAPIKDEALLTNPVNAQFMLGDMSTAVFLPQYWAEKLNDENYRKSWWNNVT